MTDSLVASKFPESRMCWQTWVKKVFFFCFKLFCMNNEREIEIAVCWSWKERCNCDSLKIIITRMYHHELQRLEIEQMRSSRPSIRITKNKRIFNYDIWDASVYVHFCIIELSFLKYVYMGVRRILYVSVDLLTGACYADYRLAWQLVILFQIFEMFIIFYHFFE